MAARGKPFIVTLLVSVLALQLVGVKSQTYDGKECTSQRDCCATQHCYALVDFVLPGGVKAYCYAQRDGILSKRCFERSACRKKGDCCDYQLCDFQTGTGLCYTHRTILITCAICGPRLIRMMVDMTSTLS